MFSLDSFDFPLIHTSLAHIVSGLSFFSPIPCMPKCTCVRAGERASVCDVVDRKNLLKIEAEPSKSSEMLLFTGSNKKITAESLWQVIVFSFNRKGSKNGQNTMIPIPKLNEK